MPAALRERLHRSARTAVLVGVIGLAAACGTQEKPVARASHSPDAATTACRAKWSDLADQIADNEKQSDPSALAERWNSVVATVDYYAASARSEDCGTRLDNQRKSISQLEAFSRSLRPWDMEYQLSAVESRAEDYVSAADSGHKGTSKQSKKGAKAAPPPGAVKKALATLRKGAPTATDDQRPGWQQANVVDLGKKPAVAKARKDLDFLSQQSKAWRECDDAVSVIRKALRSADK